MTRRLLLFLAALPVLAVAAIATLPAVIDWNAYKPLIAGRLERAIGRRVTIAGPLSLTLLPRPALSAAGVHVSGPEDSAPGTAHDLADIDRLQARLDLLALLTGRLDVEDLVLVHPILHFERLADGRGNWQLTPDTSAIVGDPRAARPPVAASPAVRRPLPSTGVPQAAPKARLEALTIEDGVLLYGPAAAPALRLEGIAGALSTAGSEGGLTAAGQARYQGTPFTFKAELGAPVAGQPSPLGLTVGLADGSGELQLSGLWSRAADGGPAAVPGFQGKLRLRAADATHLAVALGRPQLAERLPSAPLRLEAGLGASTRAAELQGLSLTLGETRASGAVRANFEGEPNVDVHLAFPRLDADDWLTRLSPMGAPVAATSPPAAAPPGSAPPAATPAPAAAPAPAPALVAAALPALALPHGVSGSVDLSADLLTLKGGMLRGFRFNAGLADTGELTINQLAVTLPGDSELSVFGFLGDAQGGPHFDGSFDIATDNLRGLAGWLGAPVEAVPADRLLAGRLSGKLVLQGDEVRLEGGKLAVDATKGEIAAHLRLTPRPALGVSLSLDNVNADAYRPVAVVPAAAGQPPGAAPAPAAAAAPAGPGDHWLDGVDANVTARVGQLVARSLTAHTVAVDAGWQQSRLTLREFSVADVAGTQAWLTGEVGGLTGGPITLHDLHFGGQSAEPARLLRQLALWPQFDAGRLGAVALSGSAEGGEGSLGLDARLEAGGGVAAAKGTVTAPLEAPRLDLAVQLDHPNFGQAVRLFAPDYRSALAGKLSAAAHLTGDASRLQLDDLHLAAGPVTADGHAALGLAGKPQIEAVLAAGDLPLDALWPGHPPAAPAPTAAAAAPAAAGEPAARRPVDLTWLNAVDGSLQLDARSLSWGAVRLGSARLGLTLRNGQAVVDPLSGQLYDGRFSASGRAQADGQLHLTAHLAQAKVQEALLRLADLHIAQGLLDAELDLGAAGRSQAEMIGRLGGAGKFAVTDGELTGFDLQAAGQRLHSHDPASLLTLFQAGFGGATKFTALGGSFQAANGVIRSDDLKIAAEGGSADGAVLANLPADSLDAHLDFHLADAPDAPPLVLRLTGALEAPRKVLDINPLQHWLAERAKPLLPKLREDAKQLGAQLSGDPPPDKPKIKPKDLLNDLLKGLKK